MNAATTALAAIDEQATALDVLTDEGQELNYEWTEIREGKKSTPKAIGRPYDEVVQRLMKLSRGRLGRVDTLVFAKPEQRGDVIHYIERAPDYFGWLGDMNKSVVDWKQAAHGAMTKPEAFSVISKTVKNYRGIETAPHWPEMEGMYYNYPALPPPDFDAFKKLISRFRPEGQEDRALIACQYATAFWGGPEGQRPAFIITSREGRGVGKTTEAEMLAELTGQPPISGSSGRDMEQFKTRLLSPLGLTSRVAIFDNETGRVSSPDLAALITCQVISGKRNYHGEGRRPNSLVWVITLNTPSLDSDLASRGIPISLSKPELSPTWKSDTIAFIKENRWGIISAILEILKSPCDPLTCVSRWGAWDNDVLARIAPRFGVETEHLLSLISERQREFDDEADEIALIRDEFMELITRNKHIPDLHEYFISNQMAATIYTEATGAKVRKNTALREIKNLISNGTLPELQECRHGAHGRGFSWIGRNAPQGESIIPLKVFDEHVE